MEAERYYEDTNRYVFDLIHCSVAKNYAQVDTSQDAWYFGTWANPFTFKIVCYAEGDVCIQTAATPEEFADALREVKAWNDRQGHTFHGIDPGLDEILRDRFIEIGLDDLLH